MVAIEVGRGIEPQFPTVSISTLRPPNRVQNGPSLNATMSSRPRAERPQQSNASTQALQVDLLKTSVVVLVPLIEKDFV